LNFFISMQDEFEIEFSHVYVTLCILNTWSFGTCQHAGLPIVMLKGAPEPKDTKMNLC
jgi:hypothetical protein